MAEEFIESRIARYLGSRARKGRIPLDGTFELTPCCNMDCKMCYIRLSKEDAEKQGRVRTVKEWLDLADELLEQGTLYLLITGGEPFLIPDLKELIEGLQKKGFIVSINSNGTLIDEKTVEWLKKYPPARINITLYGACDETYNRLCRNPNGFTQTAKAIKLLKQAGINVKLNCSLTPYNKEDLPAILKFANEHSIPIQVSPYMFPPVRKGIEQAGKNERFTPEETAFEMARLTLLEKGKNAYLNIMEDIDAYFPDTGSECNVEQSEPERARGDVIRCGAGRSTFWIDWKGDLHICGMIPAEKNNVFEIGFGEAWQNAAHFADGIRLPVECSDCPDKDKCKTCAAMVFAETATFDQKPQFRCELMKARKKAFLSVKDQTDKLLNE